VSLAFRAGCFKQFMFFPFWVQVYCKERPVQHNNMCDLYCTLLFLRSNFWITLPCMWLYAELYISTDFVPFNMKHGKRWLLLLWPTNAWRWHTWGWFIINILVWTEIGTSCKQHYKKWFLKVIEEGHGAAINFFLLLELSTIHCSDHVYLFCCSEFEILLFHQRMSIFLF